MLKAQNEKRTDVIDDINDIKNTNKNNLKCNQCNSNNQLIISIENYLLRNRWSTNWNRKSQKNVQFSW